ATYDGAGGFADPAGGEANARRSWHSHRAGNSTQYPRDFLQPFASACTADSLAGSLATHLAGDRPRLHHTQQIAYHLADALRRLRQRLCRLSGVVDGAREVLTGL